MASSDLLTSRPSTDPGPATPTTGARRLRGVVGRALPELGALVAVAVLWPATGGMDTTAGGPGPGFVPRVLLALLGGCALVGLVLEARRARSGRPRRRSQAVTEDDGGPTDLRRALLASGLVLGYVASTAVLGFVIASAVFTAGFLWLAGRRGPWVLLGVSVAAPLLLAYVFVKVVYIALPTGVGPFDTATVAVYAVFGIY